MKTLSVCSGIGAPEASGEFEAVGMCEIDPKPAAILRRHFPGVPIHADLADRGWWDRYAGIECIVGGTPCQSFSIAGKRQGLGDERGNLMLAFLNLVSETRPQHVIWENVPGVLTRKMRPAFDLLVNSLKDMGYFVEDMVLDAQHFGVPQHRPRVFVVASPSGIDLHDALHVRIPSSVHGIIQRDHVDPRYDISQRAAAGVIKRRDRLGEEVRKLPPVLRDALSAVAEGRPIGEGGLHYPSMADGMPVSPAVSASGTGFSRAGMDRTWTAPPLLVSDASIAPTMTAKGHGVSDGSMHAKQTPPYLVVPSDDEPVAGPLTRDGLHPAFVAWNGGGGRLPGGRRGREPLIVQSRRLRRFTPTEVERLMGFPDGWTAVDDEGREVADTPRYKMLGNSMAVPVIGWIGRRINERSYNQAAEEGDTP